MKNYESKDSAKFQTSDSCTKLMQIQTVHLIGTVSSRYL